MGRAPATMVDAQQPYWDGVAASARFTHPLRVASLSRYMGRILERVMVTVP
jgi:hypothetical protein